MPRTNKMKVKSALENWCLFSLVLLAMIAVESHQQSFGSTCGPNDHCEVNKGLICEEASKTCQCGNDVVSSELSYNMAWDAKAMECLGSEKGACVGTQNNPIVDDRLKKVRCGDGLVCQQVENLPPGVGVCSKTSPGGEGGEGGGSAANSLTGTMGLITTITFTIALSIFVHA